MIKKLTSIIINTRNGHQTINRAIRSALDQSFKNIEIIVYDNASNPPINSVIEVVSNKLEIVRCNEALNLGEARNRAFKASSGEYIVFLDDDDIMLPNKIDMCINAIKTDSNVGMVYTNVYVYHQQAKRSYLEYNSEMPNDDKIKSQSSVTCDSDCRGWKDWEEKFNIILYDVNELPLGKEEYDENNFLVFTTHSTLGLQSFNDKIDKIKNLKKFLIVDEVHGITEGGSKTRFRNDYDFRLGLSATPTRHFDPDGTQTIYDYFDNELDKPTYSLDLETAIKNGYLCPYDYFPSYVPLTEDEMHKYRKLTVAIAAVMDKKKKGTYKN